MDKHPLVYKPLVIAAYNLIQQLKRWPKEPRNTRDDLVLLLLVFDEAANLWVRPDMAMKDGTYYFVLRKALGMLKKTPVWNFLLSTQSSPERSFRRGNWKALMELRLEISKSLNHFLLFN